MTTTQEQSVRDTIAAAKPIGDPFDDMVKKATDDPGTPFEPENIKRLAALKKREPRAV